MAAKSKSAACFCLISDVGFMVRIASIFMKKTANLFLTIALASPVFGWCAQSYHNEAKESSLAVFCVWPACVHCFFWMVTNTKPTHYTHDLHVRKRGPNHQAYFSRVYSSEMHNWLNLKPVWEASFVSL